MSLRYTVFVFRGGGWFNNVPSWVRAGIRNRDAMTNRDDDVGFRCVRE